VDFDSTITKRFVSSYLMLVLNYRDLKSLAILTQDENPPVLS